MREDRSGVIGVDSDHRTAAESFDTNATLMTETAAMVINAKLGSLPEFKDIGICDEAVRDGKLAVKPVQRGHDLFHDPAAGPLAPLRGQRPRD